MCRKQVYILRSLCNKKKVNTVGGCVKEPEVAHINSFLTNAMCAPPYTLFYVYIYIYIYVYLYMYLCIDRHCLSCINAGRKKKEGLDQRMLHTAANLGQKRKKKVILYKKLVGCFFVQRRAKNKAYGDVQNKTGRRVNSSSKSSLNQLDEFICTTAMIPSRLQQPTAKWHGLELQRTTTKL